MSADTHILELIPAYALGCLDEEETMLASEHLAGCSACQIELRAYEAVVDQLALAAPEATPSPALKGQLMDRIQPPYSSTPAQPQSSRWRLLSSPWQRITPMGGLAGLLLILVLAIGSLLLWQQINRSGVAIGPEGMRAISISSTVDAPGASGFIIISADGRNGAVVVDQLPPLDSEREYQLWLIRDGQRTSGALFSSDEDGYGGARIRAPEPLSEYSAVEVTIEPTGGSPDPTGEIVLSGPLS